MSLEREAVASATIELLEARLRRLEYLLTGETRWSGEPTPPPRPDSLDHTVARRLARLEEDLEALSARKPVVQDVLQLHARFPELFSTSSTDNEKIPPGLTTQHLASIVLSYASAFPETASRLNSLKDLPIPDAKASAALIELGPRLAKLAEKQQQQAKEISELRARSAKLLQRWYELGLLGNSECWAEWEARLERVERGVRRREVARERREKEI
ncbi:hypothetical protein VTN49DRAFT_5046 [Thermomyces lanuginosus]|uniref:uncharacterized protein n=1 Tax=Thermomyces lanuginosus TaxID=5541 RepID=UPI003742549A